MSAGFNLDLAKLKNIKLTKEQQQTVVGAVLLAAGAVYGYWHFIMTPLGKEIGVCETALVKKEESLKKAKVFKREDYLQRLTKVQAGLQFVSRRLPAAEAESTNLKRFIKITLESGIELVRYVPEKGAITKPDMEGYRKNVATIEVRTDFHKLGMFLSRLSGEEPVFYVADMQLRSLESDQGGVSVVATMKLINYSEKTQ